MVKARRVFSELTLKYLNVELELGKYHALKSWSRWMCFYVQSCSKADLCVCGSSLQNYPASQIGKVGLEQVAGRSKKGLFLFF